MKILRVFLIAIAVMGTFQGSAVHSEDTPFAITIRVLSPEGGVAKSGQNIVLEVRMVNNSDRTIVVSEGNPADDYEIDISDDRGIRPAVTNYGTRLRRSAAGVKIRSANRNVALTLRPGEAGTDVIPIGAMYDIRKPGRYSVKVRRKLPRELGEGSVWSNSVTITIN